MERQIQFITILCVLGALHLSPSTSVPVPDSNDRNANPFKTKGGEESRFFEGDIRLLPEEDPYNSRKRSYKSKRMTEDKIMTSSGDDSLGPTAEKTWPGGIVPYMFEQTLSTEYRMLYEEAMKAWEDVTCIDFVHKDMHDEDYLLLSQSELLGCTSYIGRKGGEQSVTMDSMCATVGHAIHELGHAIGMWHEHSRPDRDTYIQVNYDNILEPEQKNFGILDDRQFLQVPDVGYDVESIMHYGQYAFTRNGQKTIELRPDAPIEDCDNRLPLGQRTQLSYKDKTRANKLYKCEGHLELMEPPECVKDLTPTPSITVPTTTAMPTPTTTQPPITPAPISPRLKSGNILTFQFEAGTNDRRGMRCTPSPGCIPKPCIDIFGTNSCSNIEHQFAIYNPTSKKIKSGNIIVLRSVFKPTTWLDCNSDSRGRCLLSQCIDNAADSANASYITECDVHQFKILGVNRGEGKILNADHKIQLKHPVDDTYLNCSGKRCHLGEPQTFTLNKLRE